eukprot:890853-Prorocentrum_minimum.AAC.3
MFAAASELPVTRNEARLKAETKNKKQLSIIKVFPGELDAFFCLQYLESAENGAIGSPRVFQPLVPRCSSSGVIPCLIVILLEMNSFLTPSCILDFLQEPGMLDAIVKGTDIQYTVLRVVGFYAAMVCFVLVIQRLDTYLWPRLGRGRRNKSE